MNSTEKIPINRLRIEWNDAERGGGFRLSHIQHDEPDHALSNSGGACYTGWQEMDCDDARLEAWLWWTICSVLSQGVQPSLVWGHLDEAIVPPQHMIRRGFLIGALLAADEA